MSGSQHVENSQIKKCVSFVKLSSENEEVKNEAKLENMRKEGCAKSSGSDCPQKCPCAHVDHLLKLLNDIKCLRKRIKEYKTNSNEKLFSFQLTECDIDFLKKSTSFHCLVTDLIQTQREKLKMLHCLCSKASEDICKQEKEIHKTDSEITTLQCRMNKLKITLHNFENSNSNNCEAHDVPKEDLEEIINLEIQERCKLQKKLHNLTSYLQNQKYEDEKSDEKRVSTSQNDNILFLKAADFIKTCLNDAKKSFSLAN